MANRLSSESSPYLLQHANNPVHWQPWDDAAWAEAKEKNKLVLVSIGYSACHWCHVMEHESFEDEEVARIMNEYFICIKVDREERPDVDQVYMTAVQMMTGSGGWPLNCFTLPDGRPIYGGTYFPKENWLKLLKTLEEYFRNDPEKVFQYATELTSSVRQHELIPPAAERPSFSEHLLNECVENWKKRFDNNEGGPMKAPKFPLPNNYLFLLRQYHYSKDSSLIRHIDLTLEKMAFGGINDQLGGGFARYSTDMEWKVPHFEKMLYDNAQLVSLYSEAYRHSKNPLYKQVVYETLEFIQREMTSPDGAFYSAIDADSEGEEGKYYVWTVDALRSILEDDMKLFAEYFNVNAAGYWEEENYILLRKQSDSEIAKRNGLTSEELQTRISALKKKVLTEREKRIKPGLDNKVLTSWNALMIKGYADAYRAFGDESFLKAATRSAEYVFKNRTRNDGGLFHSTDGKRPINGFLEDYCFMAEALLELYEVTFDTFFLNRARSVTDYAIEYFQDPASGMFYFTSSLDKALIARKMELQDNVTPASNSCMAHVLFRLGRLFDENRYTEMSKKMLSQVQEGIVPYGSAYSNWALLMQYFLNPVYEIAIVGKDVNEKRKSLFERYIPNAIFVGAPPPDPLPSRRGGAALPLLEGKYVEGKTLIYVCENKTCKAPTENITEALEQLTAKME